MQFVNDFLDKTYAPAVLVFLVGYIYICASRKFRATVLWIGVVILLVLGVYRPDGGGMPAGA